MICGLPNVYKYIIMQTMENATEQIAHCKKCTEVMVIIQSNEQMIQQQVKLIKKLHQENVSLKEQCLNLQKQSEKLAQGCNKNKIAAQQTVQQASQTESFSEELFVKRDKMGDSKQELKESTKINSKTKSSSRENSTVINKENLYTILPIGITKKEEQYFSRKRKNSNEEEHHSASWLKAINSPVKLTQQAFKAKTVDFLKKFVPHELRHFVWPSVQKNTLMISEQLYFQLQQRKNLGWVSKQVKNQISRDINRSFSGHSEASQKEGLKIEITEVLEMFHLYRPDVSYIQGMTYPIIVLTLVTGKVKAFRIFTNLVLCSQFFRKLYTFESHFMLLATKVFQLLLFDYHPQVAEKLAYQKIDPNIFLVQWFYTIFSRSFSFETTLKFWDHLLYFGEVVLYRVALSIIELTKGHIMETNYEETIGLIQGFSGFIREEKLLEMMVNHKLTHQKLWRTFDKFQKSLHRYEEKV